MACYNNPEENVKEGLYVVGRDNKYVNIYYYLLKF